MKSDNLTALPVTPDGERTVLDWPYHAGVVDQVLEKVAAKVKRRQARRRRIAATATALTLVALAAFWGVPYFRSTSSVMTAAAHRRSLDLADGSHADLNARTRVRTDFRYGRRVVYLDQGEAFFSVAKDAKHPFLVETSAGTVRVTGTQFNVRVAADQRAEVTLLEGAVLVRRPDFEAIKLSPGQQLSLNAGKPEVHTLVAADLENVMAWRQGRLGLDGLSLAEAIGRLATYHGKVIAVAPDVAGLRPGGSVSLDNLAGALDALEDTLPIRVVPGADGSCRLIRR